MPYSGRQADNTYQPDFLRFRIRLDSRNLYTLLTIIILVLCILIVSIGVLSPAASVTLLAVSGLAPTAADYLSQSDFFSPSGFFGLGYIITILGPALDFVLMGPDDRVLLLGNDLGYLITPMIIVNLYVMALMMGYSLTPNKSTKNRWNQDWDSDRAIVAGTGLSIIGVIGLFTFVMTTGGIPSTLAEISAKRRPPTEYIRWLAQFIQFGAIIFFAEYLESSRDHGTAFKLTLVATLILSVILPFYGSSRTTLIQFIIILLVVGYYHTDSITGFRIFWMVPVGILVSNMMLMLRRASWQGASILDLSDLLNPLNLLGFFEANQGGLTAFAHLIHLVPSDIMYRFGSTLIAWIAFPIPRAIWPGKPVNLGQELGVVIYGKPEGVVGGGTPPFLPGEFYLNFDLFGVVIGGLFFGCLLGLLAWYFKPFNDDDTANSILYAIIVVVFGLGLFRGDLTLTITNTLEYFVVFYPILNFIVSNN